MNKKDLLMFLGLQLFAIVWAGTVFSLLESRLVAGALAGGYFLASGLFMLWRVSRWHDKWRAFMLYPLLTHVFAVSTPMLISRFWQASQGFETVNILGLPGPVFHRLSTIVFAVLIAATVVDLIRVGKSKPVVT